MPASTLSYITGSQVRIIAVSGAVHPRVEIEGDREEQWPKAFNRIELTFHCTWEGDIDKKLVDEAIDLACNRYCPIHATLSHGVKIEHKRKDTH